VTVEYLPIKHGMQLSAVLLPNKSECFPAAQLVHADSAGAADTVEYLPGIHETHSRMELDAVLSRYLPFTHDSQVASSVADSVSEYFPRPQDEHVVSESAPITFEYLPFAHGVHWVSSEIPGVLEYFPAAQSRQVSIAMAPLSVEYFPAPHSVHPDSSAFPVVSAYLPASHDVHMDSDVAPVVSKNLPLSHEIHSVCPVLLWNVPAGQMVHDASEKSCEYPASHRQSSVCDDEAGDLEFVWHGVRVFKRPSQKWLAVHPAHWFVGALKNPAMHMQFPGTVELVCSVCVFAFTELHSVLIPPEQKVFASQGVHVLDPVLSEYFPSSHCTHEFSEMLSSAVECFPTAHREHRSLPLATL